MEHKIEEKIKVKQQKQEKISRFAVKLSELRKERGISQKKAATDLGISQALLSHYEKGIRECGLDFVIRCSEYYGVTTDYLLGVSSNRLGMDNNYFSSIDEEKCAGGASIGTLSKATKMLLDTAAAVTDSSASKYIYECYVLTLYRGALTFAKAGILPKEMFKIDYTLGRELASAAVALHDAKFVFIEDKSRTGADFSRDTALSKIIEEAEEHIVKTFFLE